MHYLAVSEEMFVWKELDKIKHVITRIRAVSIDQFRYIKIQPKTIDLSTRLVGIVGFIPKSLVLRSILG